jgi:hypothetical protein
VALPPTDTTQITRFVMNANGDVVYTVRAGRLLDVYARSRSTGTTAYVATISRRRLLGFVIDAGGATAWMDSSGNVTHWDAVHGVRAVGGDRRPRRRGRASPIALDAVHGLAFVGRERAMLWSSADGSQRTLAARGDAVGDRRVLRFYGSIGFYPDGTVAVFARFRKSLPDSDYLCVGPVSSSPCDTPGIASASTESPPELSSAIFRIDEAGIEPLVQSGDTIPDLGPIADVTAHAVDGRAVVFQAVLDDERDAIARWRDGTIEAIAVDGQTIGGRTLDIGTLHEVGRRSEILVGATLADENGETGKDEIGLVLLSRRGGVRPIREPRGKRFDSLYLVQSALNGGRVAVVDEENVLFTARGSRLAPVVVPGRGAIESVDSLASAGANPVFVARAKNGSAGLYELAGTPRLLSALPPDGSFFLEARGTRVAVVVDAPLEPGGPLVPRLQVLRRGTLETVVTAGDPAVVGVVASFGSMTFAGGDVVLVAGLAGDGARHGLFAVRAPAASSDIRRR